MKGMKRTRKWISVLFLFVMLITLVPVKPKCVKAQDADAEVMDISVIPEMLGNMVSGASDEGQGTSGMTPGADTDILVENVKVTGNQAGGTVTVSFTLTGQDNGQYSISNISKVSPILDENFPFETNNEAYRVTKGTEKSVNVSYSFLAKDNLDTAYYPIGFAVLYGRNGIKQPDEYAGILYSVAVSMNIKIDAKETLKEHTAEDRDITLKVKKIPSGTYGKKCDVDFTVKSSSCEILSVTPIISEGFPFETKGDAYRSITSKGTKSLDCSYEMTVRDDVVTGYQNVVFNISYKKDGQVLESQESLNVKLKGKKVSTGEAGGTSGNTSTPRLMVTDYKTDVDAIYPSKPFKLTVHVANTSKMAISNIKVSLISEEKQFIPSEGIANAFIESMAAGEETDLVFHLQPIAGLLEQVYSMTVKTEYENGKAEAFSSEDLLYLPITLEKRISITDFFIDKEAAQIGDIIEISANINNMGESTLYHVMAKIDGDNVQETETFIGNVEPGKSGSMDVLVKADVVTTGDHKLNKITIVYEDQAGNSYESTMEFGVLVSEPVYSNLEKVKDAPDYSGVVKTIVGFLTVAALLVGIIFFFIRRNKKKQQMLDEFMK